MLYKVSGQDYFYLTGQKTMIREAPQIKRGHRAQPTFVWLVIAFCEILSSIQKLAVGSLVDTYKDKQKTFDRTCCRPGLIENKDRKHGQNTGWQLLRAMRLAVVPSVLGYYNNKIN